MTTPPRTHSAPSQGADQRSQPPARTPPPPPPVDVALPSGRDRPAGDGPALKRPGPVVDLHRLETEHTAAGEELGLLGADEGFGVAAR